MSRFSGIKRLLTITRDRASVERAVNDELQFHFDMTMRELMANGMNPDDARREAVRRFGDVDRTRERLASIDRARVGQERRAEWWSAFAQDLRYAVRGLRLKPGFALAIIVTLGLGIGANATMFGIVDRMLFRPPTFLSAPDRTGRIILPRVFRGKETDNAFHGYRRFLDLRRNTTSFDAMTPFYTRKLAIGTGDATKEMNIAVSDPDLWRMFDVKPVLGRFYSEDDNVVTDPHYVFVLSNGYWQTQYGGQKSAIGSQIKIGPATYTVIGVAPEGFSGFTNDPIIGFIPTSANMGDRAPNCCSNHAWYDTYNMTWFEAFARRKPNVSAQTAAADLTHAHELSYKAQLAEQPRNTPIALVKPRGYLAPALRARGPNPSNESKVATWLAGVALIVLLIACANVANLLLARALRRRREIAVRIALGVSRGRLLMQLLTESLVLAVLGGLTGLAIAQWGGAIMRRALLDQQRTSSAFTDSRMLLFVGALAALAGILTGLAPIIQAGRTEISATLKAGAREGHVHRSKLRVSLLVAQAALSVVLLVGTGLFVRSLVNVKNLRLGYDANQLVLVDMNWRGIEVDSIRQKQIRREMIARAKTLPSVENAARTLTVPFYSTWQLSLFVPGIDSVNKLGDFNLQAGTPELMATMGNRLLKGRGITSADGPNAPHVVVVSESMAKKIWPGQDPIGKTLRINNDTAAVTTVIGVAEDVRQSNINEPQPYYIVPIDQFPWSEDAIFIRTKGAGADQVEALRRLLQPVMPGDAYVTVTPMSALLNDTTRSWRLGATMFAVFGALALVLAAIGLYSVIAYNVTQRTHEMGVRVALGAQARDVIRLIIREGLWIVTPGIVLGAFAALGAGRWVAPLLFDVSPKDPSVMAGVVGVLLLVAVVASWIPATRAARVDPSEALRAD
jgi:predicted permease